MTAQQADQARVLLSALLARTPDLDATKLAKKIGRGSGFVRDFLNGRKDSFHPVDLSKIEDALNVPKGTIFSGKGIEAIALPRSEADRPGETDAVPEEWDPAQQLADPNAMIGERARFSRKMTPIYGRGAGGTDGRFLFNGEVQGYAPSPPSLADVKDAYAVYVHGTSMEPKYDSGQLVYAAPHVPVRAGNYVVVQIRPRSTGEPPSGYVKRFVSRSAKKLVLEQHNPPEDEDKLMIFEADDVVSVHKIVTSNEI